MKKATFFLLLIVFFTISKLQAATIYINSNTGNDATGNGTIGNPYQTFFKGYSVAVANDVLDLTGTFTWTDAAETGDAANSGYTISKSITIQGQSADQTIIQAHASALSADRRVFTLGNYAITIKRLTIRHGYYTNTASAQGAGIYIGTLTNNILIEDCNIENNSYNNPSALGQWYGGGAMAIYNTSTSASSVTVNRCNIRNNSSNVQGAAFWSYRGTTGACKIYVTNTCINNNTSGGTGSLIYAYYTYYEFTNTTISNNSAYTVLGTVWDGYTYLTNCTIAYNNLSSNVGGYAVETLGTNTTSFVYFKNSILAQNKRPNLTQADYNNSGAAITNNGNNIVETQGTATFSNGVNGCLVGVQSNLKLSSTVAGNSSLNGTQSLALQYGSVATNAGASGTNGVVTVPSTDQRGYSRIGTTDIGAAEYTANTWSGATNTDWNTSTNWVETVVPSTNSDITIPGSLSNYPLLDQSRTIGSINIGTGAKATLNTYTLSINGTVSGTGALSGDNSSNIVIGNTGSVGTLYFDQTTPGITNRINSLTLNRTSSGTSVLGNNLFAGTLTLTNGILNIGSNTLTADVISGGSGTSYIRTSGTGVLRTTIANTAAVIFPVGNTAYNPVTITNNTGSADDFSVRVQDQVLTNGTTGTTIAGTHIRRSWHIDKTNLNGGSGINFVFNWNSGEENGVLATKALFHYGGSWNKQTGTTSSTATSLTYTGYTGTFSPFAVADGSFTLPVSWLSFTGTKQSSAVLLNWSTAIEQRTENFIVQHSTNRNDWTSIGTTAAAGNSSSVQQYSFVHSSPIAGANYYRLLQKDVDGKESYSKVIAVQFGSTGKQFSIYPNPVTNGLLQIKLEQAATVQVLNSVGMLVFQTALQPGLQQLSLTHLSKGVYRIKAGDEVISFVIQ